MTVGMTVKAISTGMLYCVCFGGVSSSPLRLRWKYIAQNIAPQVIAPTISAATEDAVQNSRIAVACGVIPSDQPNRSASWSEHPVAYGRTSAPIADNLTTRAVRPDPRRPSTRCARPTARRLLNFDFDFA